MSETTAALSTFAKDIHSGLTSNPKCLSSKYFYDEKGDQLFQAIMGLEEYYLTRCEFEIFDQQKVEILKRFLGTDTSFNLVELGAGDGTKTKVLLNHFVSQGVDFSYSPIDISQHVLDVLSEDLEKSIPKLKVNAIQGDYFDALAKLNENHFQKEVVLFLGSNIGNFSNGSAPKFLKRLGDNLGSGDMLFIGFDLMKDPNVILSAYNDKLGVTKEFNVNLLRRINNELGANFDLEGYEHFPTYNPITGETKSHLVSNKAQEVFIEATGETYSFDAWEAIHMEVSQKYSLKTIHQLAEQAGFKVVKNFTDENEFYVDSLWEKI
ncbi:L-histidine N(alpha)-methyltransferase [Roseivirga echinicomitans]|uniref:Dimethylhistidine N-methyltransferase n=1 Tax=Roseivirga echinicomitans TaxID=296218 RepID=A0A150XD79_9BACT|nr:L-histidine N(alpha)-methyltransferase [Roseivirga echinicomitans]KYG76646.1 dimethylhistidine N-methyltransferase [Roseivirga echinicomitans]